MKKLITYIIVGIIPFNFLFGNPIILPKAYISELKFEENNNWILEISFRFNPYLKQDFDSIYIKSSNGFSKIMLDHIKDTTTLFVITSDSLFTPLLIDKEGDFIKLYSFLSSQYPGEPLIDSLVFGNQPGSTIDSIQNGYSITRLFFGLFSKDKSPTIGFPNDTVGTCGTLKGYVYDKDSKIVKSGNFTLDNLLSFQDDGSYLTNVYSRKTEFYRMENHFLPLTTQGLRIDTINLNINPDSIYERDIHVLDSIHVVGIKDDNFLPEDYVSIINYPNPFNSNTVFVIKIPSGLKSKERQINIYNIIGKKVFSIDLKNNLQYSWDRKDLNGSTLSSGVYYYQLLLGNNVYKNGSMILLK